MLATHHDSQMARAAGGGCTVHRIVDLAARRRARIRRTLRARAPTILDLARAVTDYVEGADPDDAVSFVRDLRRVCDAVIRVADRPGRR